ncbi:hypothetical protein AB0N65_03590 [Paenarthrobacter sp. NPDC089322]|uniref:hypothetical protein n=1 Tax=Paenarthrobacter sp. NPDC089322 TaxID=3155065 RepID=UPI0034342B95
MSFDQPGGHTRRMDQARRRRRQLALWSALPSLAALALAAKLLTVAGFGGSALHAFESGNQGGVAAAAAWLEIANIVEPHKAHFASGDAHVLAGDFEAARSDFEAALAASPGMDECKVRVNLVLTIEKLGDAAEAAGSATADGLFREALDAGQASPVQCRDEGPANAAGEGDRLDAARERLTAKIGNDSTPGEGGRDSAEAPPPAQQEQLHKLQESAHKAQQERAEGQEREEYLRSPDQGTGVDRPW